MYAAAGATQCQWTQYTRTLSRKLTDCQCIKYPSSVSRAEALQSLRRRRSRTVRRRRTVVTEGSTIYHIVLLLVVVRWSLRVTIVLHSSTYSGAPHVWHTDKLLEPIPGAAVQQVAEMRRNES